MLRSIVAPFRTAVGVLVGGLLTLVLGTFVIVMSRIDPESGSITWSMRTWARTLDFFAGLRISVEGLEHLEGGGSFVFVSNHLSNLDPPLHIAEVPASIRFLAKKELFRYPVFGQAIRAVGIVETDRQAGPAAHREINRQVARVMEHHWSLIIYPEGTRSRDGELKPFKKGAFRIAVDNGLPIVPITIAGTREAWIPGKAWVHGGPVRMVIHEPIPTTDLGAEHITDLRDRARTVIAETYERIRFDRR